MSNNSTQHPTHFLGIDPGIRGAYCVLDHERQILALADLPTITQGGVVGQRIDAHQLAIDLHHLPRNTTLAVIEGVTARKGNGVASAHSLGHSLGVITGVVSAITSTPALLPAPSLWKRALGLSAKKDTSLRAFAHLWPERVGLSLRHDQAEAALLAYFGWLNRENAIQEAWRQYEAARGQEGLGRSCEEGMHSGHSTLHPPTRKKKPVKRRAKRGSSVKSSSINDLGAFAIED